MNTDERAIREEQNRRTTAEHEVAHALAYDALGLMFDVIDAVEGLVTVRPRRIPADKMAFVALAGEAQEVECRRRYLGPRDLVDVLEGWAADVESLVANPDLREDMADLYCVRHSDFTIAAARAIAFVEANKELIVTVADAIEVLDGIMAYADFSPFVGATRLPSAAEVDVQTERLQHHPDPIHRINSGLRIL